MLRYRIDAVEKCFSPRSFKGFRQGLRGFQRTKFRRNYVGHKRIVPGPESALGTNSLIQIHERPSVYPPLEGSAIKTDSSMDDGGIRPAVNQTTKFLVSARAACWEVLSMGEADVPSLLAISLPLLVSSSRSRDAQGCNYAPVGPSQSRESPSKTLTACPRVCSFSRVDGVFVLDDGPPLRECASPPRTVTEIL